MKSATTTFHTPSKKAQVSAGKQACPERSRRVSKPQITIIAAHKYVSPRSRPITPEACETAAGTDPAWRQYIRSRYSV